MSLSLVFSQPTRLVWPVLKSTQQEQTNKLQICQKMESSYYYGPNFIEEMVYKVNIAPPTVKCTALGVF